MTGNEEKDENILVDEPQNRPLYSYEDMANFARYQARMGRIIEDPKKVELAEKTRRREERRQIMAQRRPNVLESVSKWFGFAWNKGIKALTKGFLFVKDFFFKRKKPVERDYIDMNHIPGFGKDVHFEEVNPDKGPADQPILSDTRRLPLVFERPIPEPTDAKPTISFAFDQGKEGDVRSRVNGEMGHGIVRLKYTRMNPITRRDERYCLEIGFYPKGGTISASGCAAQVLKGLTVPGQLINDSGHHFSVEKTVDIDNRSVNKVILLAQNYEKDGYNFINRNCTTFVADAAKAAGVDMTNILKQVELSGRKIDIYAASTAGEMFLDLAKRNLQDVSDKNDMLYQRFGGKLVMQDDIDRLNKTNYRIDLVGYTPAHSAEMVRNDSEFRVSSRYYEGSLGKNDFAEDEKEEEKRMMQCRRETELFKTSVSNILRRRGIDAGDKLTEISQFIDKNMKNVEEMYSRAFLGKSHIHPNTVLTNEEKSQAIFDGTKAIDEFKKGLGDIYDKAFGKDADFNLTFQHMASVLEYVKDSFAKSYADRQNQLASFRGKKLDDPDTMSQRASFANSKITFQIGKECYNADHGTVAACAQCLDDPQKMFTEGARYNELNRKSKTESLSRDEKKEMSKLGRALTVRNTFVDAQMAYFSKEHFTKAELDYMFNGIRRFEQSLGQEDRANSTSAIFQSLALEKVCGGSKKKLLGKTDEIFDKIIEVQQNEKNRGTRNKTIGKYIESMEDALAEEFLKNIDFNKPELKDIIDVMREGARADKPMNQTQYRTKEEYDNAIEEIVSDRLSNRLVGTYMGGMLREVHDHALDRMKEAKMPEPVSDAFDRYAMELDMKMSAGTAMYSVKNAVRAHLGLAPITPYRRVEMTEDIINKTEAEKEGIDNNPSAVGRYVIATTKYGAKTAVEDYYMLKDSDRTTAVKEDLKLTIANGIVAKIMDIAANVNPEVYTYIGKNQTVLQDMAQMAFETDAFETNKIVEGIGHGETPVFLSDDSYKKAGKYALMKGKFEPISRKFLGELNAKMKTKEAAEIKHNDPVAAPEAPIH